MALSPPSRDPNRGWWHRTARQKRRHGLLGVTRDVGRSLVREITPPMTDAPSVSGRTMFNPFQAVSNRMTQTRSPTRQIRRIVPKPDVTVRLVLVPAPHASSRTTSLRRQDVIKPLQVP